MKRVLLFLLTISSLSSGNLFSVDLKNKIVGGVGVVVLGVSTSFKMLVRKNKGNKDNYNCIKIMTSLEDKVRWENKRNMIVKCSEELDNLKLGIKHYQQNKSILQNVYYQKSILNREKDPCLTKDSFQNFNFSRPFDLVNNEKVFQKDVHYLITFFINKKKKLPRYELYVNLNFLNYSCLGSFSLVVLAFLNHKYRWV